MLIDDHSLIEIYGIKVDDVLRDGISTNELIFIDTSLDASSAHFRISGEKECILTDYRKNFLKNSKVRTVWKKYLRNKTYSPSPWTIAVDNYIAAYEAALGRGVQKTVPQDSFDVIATTAPERAEIK